MLILGVKSPANNDVVMFNGTAGQFRNQPIHLSTNLTDVYTNNINNGDVIIYNTMNNRWQNTNINYITNKFGAQQIVINNLDDIGDVNATSSNNNDILTYSSSSSTWVNAPIPSGTTAIQGCTDVSITESDLSGSSNVFYWNHGDNKFECKMLSLADLPNIIIISITGNNGLCSSAMEERLALGLHPHRQHVYSVVGLNSPGC